MRKILIALFIVLDLAVFAVLGTLLYTRGTATALLQPQPSPVLSQPTPAAYPTLAADTSDNAVVSQGRVTPARNADLSLTIAGVAKEVLVSEGDRVEANQLLLRLDSQQQETVVAQAEAVLKRTQAILAELKAGPRPQEVAVKQAGLAAAQAAYQELKQGPNPQDLIAARADLANAEATRRQAQAAYDRIGGANNPTIATTSQSRALEQATNASNAAKARLDALQAPPSSAQFAAAYASIQSAQAELDLVMAGPRAEEITAAEADVEAAEAVLAQSKLKLAETELRAPFAGTVANLQIEPGEQVRDGYIVMKVIDSSDWQIQTTNLDEQTVNQIHVGDPVTVTFVALPGLELAGTVRRVELVGEENQGNVFYTVTVEPSQKDARIRGNMTAQLKFESK